MNPLHQTLSLVSKLIAREVQNLKALILVCSINAPVLILWSKAAANQGLFHQRDEGSEGAVTFLRRGHINVGVCHNCSFQLATDSPKRQ